MKKLKLLFLSLMLILSMIGVVACGKKKQEQTESQTQAQTQIQTQAATVQQQESTKQTQKETSTQKATSATQKTTAANKIDENKSYTSKEDVALYIHTYKKLPNNFITKTEAEKLGWTGGSLEKYAPGKCIGGDYFGNYDKKLPTDKKYNECDIDTLKANSRGAKRLVYTKDGDVYYTEDHYETFIKLY